MTPRPPYSISGTVFEDNGGTGTLGVNDGAEHDPVAAWCHGDSLSGGERPGVPVRHGHTDASGFYSFTDLPAGNYVVKVDTTGTIVEGMQQTVDPDQGAVHTLRQPDWRVTHLSTATSADRQLRLLERRRGHDPGDPGLLPAPRKRADC